jgi:hypothetical protein
MGNQMFQYATARALAERHRTTVRLNVEALDNDPMREYSLGLWRGLQGPVCRTRPATVLQERNAAVYDPSIETAPDECALSGYWQTERYFAGIGSLLREEFQPNQPLVPFAQSIERQIAAEGTKSCFLTIRRTDYVNNPFHGVLPLEYYQEAARRVAAVASDPCFFVFSDEPEWAREHFRLPFRTVLAGNFDRTTKGRMGREDSELWLMRQCHHAIMANSSYSWWGAWLNPTPERTVIAPKQWMLADGIGTRDIVPKRWATI